MDNYYLTRYTWDEKRTIVWKEIVRFLSNFLKNEKVILDLGSGYCDFINNVKSEERIAVDISPDFSKYADRDVKTIQTISSDLSMINSNYVDLVFSSNLLEHLEGEDLNNTLNEIKRVLKNDGIFITMQPNYRLLTNKRYFEDPTHKTIFSDKLLEDFLISQKFTIIKKFPKFLPLSFKSRFKFIPIFSIFVRTYLFSPFKPFAGQMLFIATLKK